MVRPPCCDLKKGPWTGDEDAKMLAYISKNGTGTWTSAKKGGMKRCGKSCKRRWSANYSKPDLKHHESFTPEEEELIIKFHAAIGCRWAIIAQQLPGRTDNDIKNHWNTKLKKKLKEMGIDPVTHKPFSQIFADYGNIGVLSNEHTGPNHIINGTIKRDLKKHTFSSFTPPKTDPNHNNTFSTTPTLINNYPNDHLSNSLDLLSQLQAITLVTEGSRACNYSFFTQMTSPNASSTSACSSSTYNNAGQNQMAKSPEPSFSWHDFLQDPTPNQLVQEQQAHNGGSGFSLKQLEMPAIGNTNNRNNGDMMNNRCEVQGVSSSSTSSDASLFLEAMLDQENDMFLNFPGLMEDPLY